MFDGKLNFAIFGLGDTVYENFNAIGKYFDSTFSEMGGNRLVEMGVGNSEFLLTEEQFDTWKCDLWKNICEHFMAKNQNENKVRAKKAAVSKKSSDPEDSLPLKMHPLDGLTDSSKPEVSYEMSARHHILSKRVKIESITELRQEPESGSTLEVTFDIADSGLTYKTAQNLAMFPENTDSDVQFVLKHIGVEDSQHYTQFRFSQNPALAKKVPAKHPIVSPFTPFDAVKKFVDLRGALVKKTIKSFSAFYKKQDEADRMVQIAGDKTLFQTEISGKYLGLLDIFKLFPSCKPSLSALI